MTESAVRISVDELTEAAFSGVLRAMEARNIEMREFPGPILVGIIAWPELGKMAGQVGIPSNG